ncbi:hypothetical protein DFP72DRAFT_847278 [Ephemerocybe angulata]|uniref:Uncharacterized protein n=1 Tax=Ephemerocybe angulata TaxID=980116 RepID=A0A8H6HYN6_9AGAR|nr:hypothetical protein DFP72DRAFT_847278 [Tulosesus angulatus]
MSVRSRVVAARLLPSSSHSSVRFTFRSHTSSPGYFVYIPTASLVIPHIPSFPFLHFFPSPTVGTRFSSTTTTTTGHDAPSNAQQCLNALDSDVQFLLVHPPQPDAQPPHCPTSRRYENAHSPSFDIILNLPRLVNTTAKIIVEGNGWMVALWTDTFCPSHAGVSTSSDGRYSPHMCESTSLSMLVRIALRRRSPQLRRVVGQLRVSEFVHKSGRLTKATLTGARVRDSPEWLPGSYGAGKIAVLSQIASARVRVEHQISELDLRTDVQTQYHSGTASVSSLADSLGAQIAHMQRCPGKESPRISLVEGRVSNDGAFENMHIHTSLRACTTEKKAVRGMRAINERRIMGSGLEVGELGAGVDISVGFDLG